MLKEYFKFDMWNTYLLAMILLVLSVVSLGMIGPALISAESTIAVWIGIAYLILVYPFLMFLFGMPLMRKLRRIL